MVLRAHTLGVAGVLFEDPPTGGDDEVAAKKKWARDDAICRGHMLATLSDRLLPDYARHATARALWDAVARTYDVNDSRARDRFREFRFDEGGHFLEQLAHAEALGVAAEYSDESMACWLTPKLPEMVGTGVALRLGSDKKGMSLVWEMSRRVMSGIGPERLWNSIDSEDDVEYQEQAEETACWNCGMPGHIARNCSVAGHNNAKKCKRRA
ncbi:hypothetical protein PR202_ga21003 [Eleusine coracana subsp. coracana]|uniref:CCHC-type domain-containing protein n=1 Tax=Eleusine coracana subsp. coracana TaxID=191504 RepID=A0AAV5D087_ELECO|nr:hypothetical protein PR202_ga21003 [Eleusine coracana subsp. coracana]